MPPICIDAHVHIHPCFRLEELLHCACRNFRAEEQKTGAAQAARFLFLTESAGAESFAGLAAGAAAGRAVSADLCIQHTPETAVLRCDTSSGASMFLVAGRQIVTAEGLELLALGHGGPVADGQPIRKVLAQLASQSCLRVLPWGVGKWLGTRGKLVQTLVREVQDPGFFLGDNGNRPFFWPLPTLFAEARQRGIRNLPGSDPLPFPGQERKVGGFGLRLLGSIDLLRPFASLCALLQDPAVPLHPFGHPERLSPFLRHQVRMRLRKTSPAITTLSA